MRYVQGDTINPGDVVVYLSSYYEVMQDRAGFKIATYIEGDNDQATDEIFLYPDRYYWVDR